MKFNEGLLNVKEEMLSFAHTLCIGTYNTARVIIYPFVTIIQNINSPEGKHPS
jgi:hypothetical protein